MQEGMKAELPMPPGPNWPEGTRPYLLVISVLDGTSAWHPPVLHSSHACPSHGSSLASFAVSAQMSPPQACGPPEQTLWNGLSHSFLFHLLQNKHQFHKLLVIIFPSDYNIHWASERSSKAFSYEAFLLWFLIALNGFSFLRYFFFLCHVSWRV